MADLLDEFNQIISKKDRVIAEIATDLFAELQSITPVKTGQLKIAWELEKTEDGYIITNNMEYASIALSERGFDSNFGKVVGSTQFPQGINPTLDKYERKLEIALRKI